MKRSHVIAPLVGLIALASPSVVVARADTDRLAIELIESFNYTNIKDVHDRGAWEILRPRLRPKSSWHLYQLDNPDPAWLPGWAAIQAMRLDDRAASALIQARINKTWAVQCDADFDDYVAGWNAVAEALEPRLAALEAEPSVYHHKSEARAIVVELFKLANERKLWLSADSTYRYSGPYHDILRRIADVVVGRSELLFRLDAVLEPRHAAPLTKHGRSWGDLDDERKLFCGEATDLGTHRTYKAYRVYRDARVAPHVRWPVDPAELARLRAAAAAAANPDRSVFARGLRLVEMLGGIKKTKTGGDYPQTPREHELVEQLRYFGGLTVKSATAAKLVLTRTDTIEFEYDCVDTDRVDRINPRDGRVSYVQRCKTGTGRATMTLELAGGPRPRDLTLRPGDVVSGYALITARDDKVSGTTSRQIDRITVKGTLHMLERVERKGKELGRW